MFIIRFAIKAVVTIAVLTAIGQIRINDVTLEQRYHHFVNSKDFQTWFWALSLPVQWGSEKLEKGLKALEDTKDEQSAAR